MIERKFVQERMKQFMIQEYMSSNLRRVGHSHTNVQRTPLGEKITVFASRPGLVVGRKGQNIKRLTTQLKKDFDLENPQIEISEVEDIYADPQIVAERIADSLERFGSSRFKGIGHKTMEEVMNTGALGVEILISGKLPSSRAKRWRFYSGYLKKCGDIALFGVKRAYTAAQLKTGTIGVQVRIMPSDIKLPDSIELLSEKKEVVEELPEKPASSKKADTEKKAKKPKATKAGKKVKEKAEKTAEEKIGKKVEEKVEDNESKGNADDAGKPAQ
ncbi:MAG: 30S ribosomal protein S3 [Nanoarchaeota archaeon]|nr:30S ribosomal protein S3 [Nanoarchaeota archaeon]